MAEVCEYLLEYFEYLLQYLLEYLGVWPTIWGLFTSRASKNLVLRWHFHFREVWRNCWRVFLSVRQNILQLLWPKSPYWESTRGEKVSFSHQTHLKYIPFFILDYRSICPECGKPFTRLEGHLKSVHNIRDKVVETINTVNKSMTWYWEEPKNKMRTKNDDSPQKDLIKEKIKIFYFVVYEMNQS